MTPVIKERVELRYKFEKETSNNWENSQGEPDIDYVLWLESELIQSQQREQLTDERIKEKIEQLAKSIRDENYSMAEIHADELTYMVEDSKGVKDGDQTQGEIQSGEAGGIEFYIRNEGYMGNALIWWEKGRSGYTCDIKNAHRFTEKEAMEVCKRPGDSAYECEYIDNLIESHKLIIDSQYVDYKKQLWKE